MHWQRQWPKPRLLAPIKVVSIEEEDGGGYVVRAVWTRKTPEKSETDVDDGNDKDGEGGGEASAEQQEIAALRQGKEASDGRQEELKHELRLLQDKYSDESHKASAARARAAAPGESARGAGV